MGKKKSKNTASEESSEEVLPQEKVDEGEKQWHLTVEELRKLSKEQCYNMIMLNYGEMPKCANLNNLKEICADGMVFGAIKNKCGACKSPLYFEEFKYKCCANALMRRNCPINLFLEKRAHTAWRIPTDLGNKHFEEWFKKQLECRRFKNLKKESVLPSEMVAWRTEVIRAIESYKIKENIYENYSSFLTNRDDFIGRDHRYGFVQLYGVGSGYAVYVVQRIYKGDPLTHEYSFTLADEAEEKFKEVFANMTGFEWEKWLAEDYNIDLKKLYPVKINLRSKLTYEEDVRISDVHSDLHEDLIVQFDNLRINKSKIEKNLIKVAMENNDVTLVNINHAFLKVQFLRKDQEHARYLVPVMERDLNNLLKEDASTRIDMSSIGLRLRSLSIVSRLISLPMKTTLLIDLNRPIVELWGLFLKTFKEMRPKTYKTYEESGIYRSSYVLDTVAIIGRYILQLALSRDVNGLHCYSELLDSTPTGCWCSILLRKVSRDFSSSDPMAIVCTIDIESVPEPSQIGELQIEPQECINKILMSSSFDKRDWTKYGYIVESEKKERMKIHLVFRIKYTEVLSDQDRTLEPEDEENWKEFLCGFGPKIKSDVVAKAKEIVNRKIRLPYIYLGEDHENDLKEKLKKKDSSERVPPRKRPRTSGSKS